MGSNPATAKGEEVRGGWMPVIEGEGPENWRRWCVVALVERLRVTAQTYRIIESSFRVS